MTGAAECDIYEKCTAVLSGTLGHNEDGYAPESTAAIIQWLQSLKLGGEWVSLYLWNWKYSQNDTASYILSPYKLEPAVPWAKETLGIVQEK